MQRCARGMPGKQPLSPGPTPPTGKAQRGICGTTDQRGGHARAGAGQQAALHLGRLSFRPLFAPPYALPVLLLGTEGALEADAAGGLTLRVAFGAISLPAGGLSVDGVAYAGAIDLGPGDAVSWTR